MSDEKTTNLEELKDKLYADFDAVREARRRNGWSGDSLMSAIQAGAEVAKAIVAVERLISPINP